MKKIFSLSLMAVALLISGNAKADFVSDWQDASVNGGTITLDESVDLSDCLEIIDQSANEVVLNTGKSVTIDLNGNTINGGSLYRFMINSGTLSFTGQGVVKNSRSNSCVFKVMGSNVDVANYSVLNIGKDVTVMNEAGDGYGILLWGSVADNTKAYGAVANIDGKVYGGGGAITINGNVKTTTGTNFPTININATAEVKGTNFTSADEHGCYNTAVYCAGYGIWNIKGYVEGATGIYVKSGVVNLDGACVVATGERNEPQNYGNGPTGSGDAIVYDTNNGYAGNTELNVIGNTSVFSEEGYAINEVITSGSTTKVVKVDIQSGEFNGAEGGIVTTDALQQKLTNNTQADYSISGGTFNNDDLAKYLDPTKVETIEVDGKQVVVTKDATITEREVVAGNFGTICYSFNSTNYAGAIFFQIDEADETGLTLVEVPTLQAGYPYIFLATASKIVLEPGAESNLTPQTVNHLVGSYTEADIEEGKYIIKNNLMTPCGTGCKVGANRAYIDLGSAGAPVQARRVGGKKVTLTADATTALPETAINAKVLKSIANGKFMIVKDGVKFNAAGQKIE